jgi:hypothetical protein
MTYGIAHCIAQILKSDSPVVRSWSPTNFIISPDGLEFDVSGLFLTGRVRILSDSKMEYFDVIFFESNHQFHEGVFVIIAGELIQTIDNKVNLGFY